MDSPEVHPSTLHPSQCPFVNSNVDDDAEKHVENASSTKSEQGVVVSQHVPGLRLFVILLAFMLASCLMSLDQTIVATALPSIASDFNAISQLAWIASGYFLSQAGLMLLYGKVLGIASSKYVLLVAIAIFEAGSLICALSNSIQLLIFGRVFAGSGAAGIWVSVLSILAEVTPLEKRPIYLGLFGIVFAISSIVGPLLGGVFSQHLTWRWCFWINLPLGALAMIVIAIVLPNASAALDNISSSTNSSLSSKWLSVDWLGSLLSISITVVFLIPLQWGGNTKPWNDPAVISLLCLSFVLLLVFILWEMRKGTSAMLPLTMFRNRTQVGACLTLFFLYICFVVGVYFLPFYYQVTGSSPTRSGINILPYMLSGVISAGVMGGITNATHHYWCLIVFPPLLGAIGGGLLFTVDISTSSAKLIGYQILFGAGIGAALQNPILAVQAEYRNDARRIALATSICSFSQLIGLSVGLAIGTTLLENEFQSLLAETAPGLPAAIVQAVRQNVEAISSLPDEARVLVMAAYTSSISRVFLITVPCAILSSISALLIKNHRL